MTTRREFIQFGLASFVECQQTNRLLAFDAAGSLSFRELCESSLREAYAPRPDKSGDGILSVEIQNRLDQEIEILDQLGLTEQFRRLWDLSHYLQRNKIPFVLHGPANGSLVVFASGIGQVCPLDHGLLIERLFQSGPYLNLEIPEENEVELKTFGQVLFQLSEPKPGRFRIGFYSLLRCMSEWMDELKKRQQVNRRICLFDDPKTFELLQSGKTEGVYQLGSETMQNLLRSIRPRNFSELMACIALCRPGPIYGGPVSEYRRWNDENARPILAHPVLGEILAETRGIILYQEQVILLLHRLGGMTVAEACELRRGIGQDKAGTIAELRNRFLNSAARRGLSQGEAVSVLDQVGRQGSFSFLKANAAAAGAMAYRMAFLKAHQAGE